MGNVCSVREDSPRENASRYEYYTTVWHEVVAKLGDEQAFLAEVSQVYSDECARRNRRQLTKQIWQDVTTAFVSRISCDDPRTKERIYRSVDSLYLGPGDRAISEPAFAEFTRLALELAERDLRERIGKIRERYGGAPPPGTSGRFGPPLTPHSAQQQQNVFRSAPPGAFTPGGAFATAPERPAPDGFNAPPQRMRSWSAYDEAAQQQQQQQRQPVPPQDQPPWWVASQGPPGQQQPPQQTWPAWQHGGGASGSPHGQSPSAAQQRQQPDGGAMWASMPPRMPSHDAYSPSAQGGYGGYGQSPHGGAGGGAPPREASPPRLQLPRSALRLQDLQRQQAEEEQARLAQQRMPRPDAVHEEPPPGYQAPVKPHQAGGAGSADAAGYQPPDYHPPLDGTQPQGLDPSASGASLPTLGGGSPMGAGFSPEQIHDMQHHILCGNLRVYVFNKNLELQAKRLAVNPSTRRISILRDDGLCEDSWEIESLISISRSIDASILAEPPPPGAAAFRFKFAEGDTEDRFLCVVFETEEVSRLATEAFGLLCEVPVAPG